jgi:hypothetical protein
LRKADPLHTLAPLIKAARDAIRREKRAGWTKNIQMSLAIHSIVSKVIQFFPTTV